jgi:hypothetical protein
MEGCAGGSIGDTSKVVSTTGREGCNCSSASSHSSGSSGSSGSSHGSGINESTGSSGSSSCRSSCGSRDVGMASSCIQPY